MDDLFDTLNALRAGRTSASAEMERCISAAQSIASDKVFVHTDFEAARRKAAEWDSNQALRRQTPSGLCALAYSVKDLFDVAGQVTMAGSKVLADSPAAKVDCPAVNRLNLAGGALIGRTSMVEFAFSGVGVNPHHGTPANAVMRDVPRIPGGSSSGAAVSVANGSAFIGLGSDTGGSIRIPAALNGIVGFKSTARLVPTDGALPLSFTLDTVGALTRSVRDAITAHEILAARRVSQRSRPSREWRVALVTRVMMDDADAAVQESFERSLMCLRDAGFVIEELDLCELDDLPALNASGGFSPAEAFAWHHDLLKTQASQYDPRVRARIERGASMSARDYIELMHGRRQWIAAVQQRLQAYDAAISPTVPIVPVPIANVAPGAERDADFFRINSLLLRNPAAINFLNGCAISIPCHDTGQPPVGMMIWAPALCDDTVLSLASAMEDVLK
jgi:aspartyl-tRNA(Asn)/glutamyl-tRNA(Gln) amidotransferase subunit A